MRRRGGTQLRWSTVGPIKFNDLRDDAHRHWTLTPSDTTRAHAEIERPLDQVRLDHREIHPG